MFARVLFYFLYMIIYRNRFSWFHYYFVYFSNLSIPVACKYGQYFTTSVLFDKEEEEDGAEEEEDEEGAEEELFLEEEVEEADEEKS